MAILTSDEFKSRLQTFVGDNTSDEALSFIADMADTYNDIVSNAQLDWKTKYETNDAEWRKKYRDRFFNTPVEPEPTPVVKDKPKTFNDLFKEN